MARARIDPNLWPNDSAVIGSTDNYIDPSIQAAKKAAEEARATMVASMAYYHTSPSYVRAVQHLGPVAVQYRGAHVHPGDYFVMMSTDSEAVTIMAKRTFEETYTKGGRPECKE